MAYNQYEGPSAGSAFTSLQPQRTRLAATPTAGSRALRFEEVPYSAQMNATPPSHQKRPGSPSVGLTPEVLLAAEAIEGMRHLGASGSQRHHQHYQQQATSSSSSMLSNTMTSSASSSGESPRQQYTLTNQQHSLSQQLTNQQHSNQHQQLTNQHQSSNQQPTNQHQSARAVSLYQCAPTASGSVQLQLAARRRESSSSPMVRQTTTQRQSQQGCRSAGPHAASSSAFAAQRQQHHSSPFQSSSLAIGMYRTPESDLNSTSNDSWPGGSAGPQQQACDSMARRRLNLDSVVGAPPTTSRSPHNTTPGTSGAPTTTAQRIAQHRKRKSSLDAYGGRHSPLIAQTASRQDSSLLVLTKRFLQIQGQYDNGQTVNLNEVADYLGVQKRRLYDITNVLEGIDLIEKIGKNSIRWRDDERDASSNGVQAKMLEDEIRDLDEQENHLDNVMSQLQNALKLATEDPTDLPYAYVQHQDLRSAPEMADQTVIAIRAPPGSALEVPDPSETGKMQMLVKALHGQGEVQVFLCKTDDQLGMQHEGGDGGSEPMQHRDASEQQQAQLQQPTPTPAAVEGCAEVKQETAEQPAVVLPNVTSMLEELDGIAAFHPSPSKNLFNALHPHPSPVSTSFLNLEPPAVAEMSDYLYGLGPDEGLNDLFDGFCDNSTVGGSCALTGGSGVDSGGVMLTPRKASATTDRDGTDASTGGRTSTQENRDPLCLAEMDDGVAAMMP